ncbi:MAG TPA: zinc-dependent alcohol dehydrogenase family protein [Pirellulales bacterium]|nr:zinc-dependent alcohol dehydrogenase family protein [Pirellulales bacterium]
MVLNAGLRQLKYSDVEMPTPHANEVLMKVAACGVCRTDLHVVDGELTHPKLPLIPGHEIVGRVVEVGPEVKRFQPGDRVGVPWIGHTCGVCKYCQAGHENLCLNPQFTGYTLDGGYAEFACACENYCFAIPDGYSDVAAAPLLCAGLIGYRSLRMTGDAKRIGIYGFGAAAHIIAQVAKFQGREVYAFTRPGDTQAMSLAKRCGAIWAADSDTQPPTELDAAIIFAPVGALVPTALRAVGRGGIVVCGGIHMSDIPRFSYDLLWEERVIRSVANLTRHDAEEFLALAPKVPVQTETTSFSLGQANQALDSLRSGRLQGAAVLVP